jgi:excisionase family DNA binding protein
MSCKPHVGKRTWRFKSLSSDAAAVMSTAPSLRAAAKSLGVNKSTIFRWVKAGKLPAPIRGRVREERKTEASVTGTASQQSWAAVIRERYELDATETSLVRLAEMAERIASDPLQPAAVRLAAMGRFAQITKQLNFEVPNGEVETATDGRAGLRRVV